MKTILIFIIILLLAKPVFAADKEGNFWAVGPLNCGFWIKNRGNGKDNLLDMYLAGFLTSYNFYNPNMGNILEGSDRESAALFIDNYCRQNALSSAVIGITRLIEELQTSARRNQ